MPTVSSKYLPVTLINELLDTVFVEIVRFWPADPVIDLEAA